MAVLIITFCAGNAFVVFQIIKVVYPIVITEVFLGALANYYINLNKEIAYT
jgi:hypothetical protein